jgi:acetyl esterase/lipase
VLSGESAGSHLALIAAKLPTSTGFDEGCNAEVAPRPVAIVSWYAVTDVVDVLAGENQQPYAVRWLGEGGAARELARTLSPLHHVRNGVPAVVTVHGDADQVAPYSEGAESAGDGPDARPRRLHRERARLGVRRDLGVPGEDGTAGDPRSDSSRALTGCQRFRGSVRSPTPRPLREPRS